MTSEALRRAKRKYRERTTKDGTVKRLCLEFYPSEHDVYDHIAAHMPMATYVKGLVRKDMERCGE